jgi:hypothetical protein
MKDDFFTFKNYLKHSLGKSVNNLIVYEIQFLFTIFQYSNVRLFKFIRMIVYLT